MSAPNLKEIEWAISELENQESSEGRYTLLAALYTCRNQMLGNTQPAVPRGAGPKKEHKLSAFLVCLI